MRISDWSSDVCSSDLNRNNTIAGWVLFAGICALGLTIGSGMLFASHNPEKPGYPIEDAEAGAGGGESAVPPANLLAAADRSAERRGGKEGVGTCRSRWWPEH